MGRNTASHLMLQKTWYAPGVWDTEVTQPEQDLMGFTLKSPINPLPPLNANIIPKYHCLSLSLLCTCPIMVLVSALHSAPSGPGSSPWARHSCFYNASLHECIPANLIVGRGGGVGEGEGAGLTLHTNSYITNYLLLYFSD